MKLLLSTTVRQTILVYMPKRLRMGTPTLSLSVVKRTGVAAEQEIQHSNRPMADMCCFLMQMISGNTPTRYRYLER